MRGAVRSRLPGASGQVSYPLLPAEARRAAAVAVAVCAAVTLLLGVIVHGHATADGLDHTIDRWIHQSLGGHRGSLNLVALPGAPMMATALAVVLVAACLVARRWRAAVLVTIATPAAAALTEFLLKPLVARRMGDGTGSFPSGHATAMFALAAAFCVLLAQPPRHLKPALRRLLSLGALLAATAVSVAMVGLHHHYFTDVIGGAVVGTAVVLLVAFALDWLGSRWPSRHGPPRQALIPPDLADTSPSSRPVDPCRAQAGP